MMMGRRPFSLSLFSNHFPFLPSFLVLWYFGPIPNTCQVTLEPGGFEGSQRRGLDFAGESWPPPTVNARPVFNPKKSGLGAGCPWLTATVLCMSDLCSPPCVCLRVRTRLAAGPAGMTHSVWGSRSVTWQDWEPWEPLGDCLAARQRFRSHIPLVCRVFRE